MLQTIDRALTLLVDMEAREQMAFLQTLGLTGNQRKEVLQIESKCKTCISKALENLDKGNGIQSILQSAAIECNAIQKEHAGLIDTKSYFISAMLHVIILKLNTHSPDNTKILHGIVSAITIEGDTQTFRELTPDEAENIAPEKEGYLKILILNSCRERGKCTVS